MGIFMSNQIYQALYLQSKEWFGSAQSVTLRVVAQNPYQFITDFTTKL